MLGSVSWLPKMDLVVVLESRRCDLTFPLFLVLFLLELKVSRPMVLKMAVVTDDLRRPPPVAVVGRRGTGMDSCRVPRYCRVLLLAALVVPR